MRYKFGAPLKLGPKSAITIKMLASGSSAITENVSSDIGQPPTIGTKAAPINIFADDTVPCFFR